MSFDTSSFPTVRGTIAVLERQEIEYEDLKTERREPLLDFMIKLKQSDSLGPSMFCVKLFKTLGGNPAAVAGIINDLYARGVELSREERVQFLLWFIEQETKLDEVTFDYIFRRLPKSLTQKYARGGLRAVRDLLPDQDGSESLTA
jgi:hypothetical protein